MNPETRTDPDPVDTFLLTLLIVNSVVLAMLELFFLPLRFDGRLLPDLGAAPAPVSVLVAAVATPWLVSRTARVAARMDAPAAFAALPLVLWLVTVIVLGLFGPGGDTVLVPDWRAVALLAAGTLSGSIVLGLELGKARVRRERSQ